jgi:hypothetical protein
MKAHFINEIIDFSREETNPLKKLGIGLEHFIKKITSEDLELLSIYLDHNKEKEFIEMCIENGDSEEEAKKELEKAKRIKIALKGHIFIGNFFDWKEEEEMERYISKVIGPNRKYHYAYNAYPGGDGWYVVFSDIELPNAEFIEG